MHIPKTLLFLLITACVALFALGAYAGNCENPRYASKNPVECAEDPPPEPPPPPPGEEITLDVTVFFGDEGNGDPEDCDNQLYPDACVQTSFTAVGTVICSSQVCDFLGAVQAPFFNIPPSLLNLLALTEIRGTAIVPEQCFYGDQDESGNFTGSASTKFDAIYMDEEAGVARQGIYEFWLRSPVVAGADGQWWAKVRTVSTDMAGVPQLYGFHFGGYCVQGGERCPTLASNDFTGDFNAGYTSAVFGTNTNRRGEPQTCRCTVSSKPSCPESVVIDPRPAGRIYIKRVTGTP